jgi:hypothetical protein
LSPPAGDPTGRPPDSRGGQPDDKPGLDKRLLDEIFGDVLPETTGDERASGSPDGGYSEEWYRENRPPHHGG